MMKPAAHNAGAAGTPASALCVPDDSLDIVVEHLGGFIMDGGNGCGWFDDFCDVDLDKLENDDADAFMETLETLPEKTVSGADATTTTRTPKPAEAVSNPGKPGATSLSSSSPASGSSSSEDDDGDPWLPPKSRKRVSGASAKRQPQRKEQRAPAGQTKRKRTFTAPPVPRDAVVGTEEGGGGVEKWCRHCGTTVTTLWRAGPEGPKTLCNACGLRWKNTLAPAAKLSRAKSKNSALPVTGVGPVVRKQRSVTIDID